MIALRVMAVILHKVWKELASNGYKVWGLWWKWSVFKRICINDRNSLIYSCFSGDSGPSSKWVHLPIVRYFGFGNFMIFGIHNTRGNICFSNPDPNLKVACRDPIVVLAFLILGLNLRSGGFVCCDGCCCCPCHWCHLCYCCRCRWRYWFICILLNR